jgi:large repetitive protein
MKQSFSPPYFGVPMNSKTQSVSNRFPYFFKNKSKTDQSKKRNTRRAQLEQLEARRVMAAAILEELPNHVFEANVSSRLLVGEGTGGGGSGGDVAKEFYYSPRVPGFVRNSDNSKLFVNDSDIVKLSVLSSGSWNHQIYFDGSDVGLTTGAENVDAFAIRADGSMLFSTTGHTHVPGATANEEDLMLFRPTSLGTNTAGTWELFFDGSDVGLSSWEGLDGVSELPDGRLIISVGRQADVSGLAGVTNPEDLLSFTIGSSGSNTSGSFQRYFDGSDVHLGGTLENVDGVSVDADGNTIHLSTTGIFLVPGLLGFGRDIFTFEATQLGNHTQGTYQTPLTLNGSHRGLLCNSINAIHIPSSTVVNQPPIIAAITSPTIPELAAYELQLSATDPDTPAAQLVWSLVSGPAGSQLNAATGLYTWTPTETQGPGVFPVIVAVTDGTSTVPATFSISVTEVNQPPVVAPIGNQTIDEETALTLQVNATDADLPAQALTYALGSGAPAGATIGSTGGFSWTPGEVDGPGEFTVPVVVTDALGASVTQNFTVTVREVNRSPVLAPISNQTININQTLSVTAVATDPDLPANALTYSLIAAPSSASINAQTGAISWLANVTGTANFTVQVADQGGLTSSRSFEVNVIGIELRELTNFSTVLVETLTVPDDTSSLRIEFETPNFDTSSQRDIRDAFEIELMDMSGNPLVLPYAGGVDASFNWTEGLTPVSAQGVVATIAGAGAVSTATVNLSGLPAGTQFQLRLRLVNNDSDNGSLVRINDIGFVNETTARPLGASLASSSTDLATINFSTLQDVTGNFTVDYGRTTLAASNDRLLVDVQLKNESTQSYRGPVLMVIKNLSSLDANALRPDGFTPAGDPYFQIGISGDAISTGQSSIARQIGFLNVSNERFDYQVQILAAVNATPSGFRSTPLTSIQAGNAYIYTAEATDPEGDVITYSIVSGPSSATINPSTGRLSWNTAAADVGSHRFTVRATDTFGAFVEKTFTLEVFATLQNRPPNFVSDPVTDAIASSGFEITTVATGAGPAGVSVISGFRGPRLVSINAGDQSVSVHAGQNNDRFDDTTVYSTGEPKPTGALIDVGYTVDVGLPTFLVPADRNEVLGMDQGDLNGDGILDLVVMTARFESTKPSGQTNKIEITRMLGDGDGNFGTPTVIASIATTSFTSSLTQAKNLRIADIDGDGRQDVAALQETTPRLVTVRGLGDGSFEPAVFTTLATPLNDFRLVDLDQDGNLDIVGRNGTLVDLGWMRGAGDGTYAPFVRLAAGGGGVLANNHSRPYDFADIDGDGDIDIVNSEANSGNILILVNDGSESFTIFSTIDPPGGSGSTNEGSYILHVADFTGDGRLDIFAISSAQERVDIFVGDGTGLSFTHQVGTDVLRHSGNLAGSDHPVDIDGDGDLDIVIANNFNSEPTAPQVLVNDGTGRFRRTDYPMADFPGHILATQQTNRDVARGAMFGDYNRDGVIDFAYMTTGEGGAAHDFNGVGIRLGTRPVEFGATRTIQNMTLNGNDNEVHSADFNLDGKIDLLILSNARMSLGNGDGTFQSSFPATSISAGSDNAVVADFNLDGIPDYVATRANASNAPEKIYVALGNGDGTFDSSLGPAAPGMFYHYADIRTADFNNDGYPDLIAKGAVEKFIDVYLNDPAIPGTFTRPYRAVVEVTGVNTQGFDHVIATADFDDDGNVDFVTVDQVAGQPLKLKTFSGDGAGNFTVTDESFAFDDAMFSEFNFYYPEVLESGDVNGDGHLDVVSFGRIGFIIHIGDGTGAFTSVDHYPIEYINAFDPQSGFLVDFDEDGHLDLIQYSFNETFSIRPGKGDGTFAEPQRVDTLGGGDVLTFADFDNDSHSDMAVVMTSAGNYINEDVVFYYGTRNGLLDQLAVDLDGDGNEEVLAVNEANDRLKIFTGDNLDRLNRQSDLLTGRAPQALATGDLNGDGRPEIITANRAGRSITVFSGSLASGYTSTEILVGSAPIDVLTRDINSDGHTDVLVLDEVANALWVLSGSASGILSAPVAIALGDKPGKFTVADATGDGQLDAVITLPETNRLMILSSLGILPLGAPIYLSLSNSPSDIQVTDLNADGNPDLATTLPGTNDLSVLYGRGSNQFARAQNISVGSKPTRVTLADADEDGRMDLIVANTGDNTASVIYNRFDPNEVYRYDSDAIDPDNDTLTYSIVDGPGGLIINSQTGALLWAASPDQVGEHTVTISANDGRGGIATQSFKIDVQPARDNALPLIATEPNTKIGAGETFTYQVTALDNDRDALRYSLIDAPPGAMIDPTTGKVTWEARADMALSFAPHGISSIGNIEIEAHPSLQPTSLTAEGWYNFTGLPASNGRSNIISSGVTSTTGTTYKLFNFGNASLRLEIDYPSPTATFTYSIPYVPTANRWTHFAITIDDSTRVAKIYVDGVERGSTTIPSPLIYNPTANAWVGDSTLFFTRAIIDNYRLWNVVRTPAEIAEGLSRQYDGDTRLVLDYRFDEPQTLTVRDFSPAGNHGYRKENGLLPVFAPGLAETGSHQFTIGVEDGRGGSDQQSFTLNILPELRGTIRGQAFSDLDGNGSRNGSEPVLPGVHLFIDANGNGYPDPSESQTTTDASGNYQFNGLLPGQYAVRVSALAGFEAPTLGNVSVTANTNSVVDLAMEQLALGQIRGQLRTEDLDAIAYWKVFADLDNDSELDAGEPMAASDRGGNYALSGLSAGNYTVRAELPAGWSVAGGTNGQNVTLAASAISTGNNFTLEPNNTSVTGGLHFVTTPTLTLEARQTFRYASVAIGIDPEVISYNLSLAPEGMSIDPATGLIAWRPTIAQVGEHLVVVRATSASGSIALQDFALNITAPNTAPILATDLPGTAYVGLIYAVDLSAQDAESQAITYSLLTGPSSATINASTGQLRWTPTLVDVGNVAFSIELRDSAGGVSIVNATVAVVNSQPAATPFSVTLPRTQVGLGQDYFARVQGTDALGRPLTWSLVAGPTGLLVSANGTLTWTPGNDDVGSHAIVLRATNVAGTTANSSFTLQVAGRPVNTAPVVTSTPATSTTLGKQYQYTVEVLDNDADPQSFALINAPVGMSIHPSQGTILWTPAADQLGESHVSVQVTDPDGSTATQEFKIKVSKSGGPPAITSVPPTEASVGTGYLYSIAARDAEGDPLTFRLLAAPAGMTIAQTTGVISWTPQAGQVGQQDVVIEVSDGIGGAVTQAFAIRVSTGVPNLPPVISSSAPRFGAVGTAYSYTMQATDPESTSIVYSLGQAPVGMTINASSGVVAWTPAVGQVGSFVVTLIATDAGGAKAIESFELDVLAANSQPTIVSSAPVDAPAGAVFTYQVLGRDADLDQLTYELTTAPAGATIDAFGKITWPTTPALIGPHNFAVRVTDPRGGVATQSFTLSVIEDIVPPKVSIIESLGDANRNILPWQGPFIVYVRAIDNVAVRSLTLKANGQDIPLDAAGTATFTFEDWGFQSINATATSVDTNGNITTRTINFDYDFPEGWSGAGTADIPTVAITSPTDTAAVFGMVSIVGTASHANFAGYKLSYRRIDETTYTQFFESTTAVVNGTLGVWDTSLLINDEYVIRLEAVTNAGVVNVVEHNVGLSGDLKLGNFRLSFSDVVIPVAGIPLQIARVYDSLQADRESDFGYGWRLEYRNTDLRIGLPKSGLEDIGIYAALRPGVKVYMNIPGEGRVGFTFNPEIRALPGFGNSLVLARPRFTADSGVKASLSAGTSGYLLVNEQGELYSSGGIPYNPASPDFGGAYVVTTRDGIKYRIDGDSGDMLSATDTNGNQLQFSDTGIVAANGSAQLTFVRDARGRIVSIVDPAGETLSYRYDGAGDLVSTIDREGHTTTLQYSSSRPHYLERVTDPLGRAGTRSTYGPDGRLTTTLDVNGVATNYSYDPSNSVAVRTNALGHPTIYEYDARGNLIASTDALGNVARQTYDTRGNLLTDRDALGNTTRYEYNAQNDLIATIDPMGQRTSTTVNSMGMPLSATDALGHSSTFQYDTRGNLVASTDAKGNTTRYEVDLQGNVTAIVDPTGVRRTSTYNSVGNALSQTDGLGNQTTYQYDANGNLISRSSQLTLPSGIQTATVSSSYDANGKQLSSTNELGQVVSFVYDAAGNQISITDEAGAVTSIAYDNTNLPQTFTRPAGSSSSFTYDAIGNRTQTTVNGQTTWHEFDAVGRLLAIIYEDDTPGDLSNNPRRRFEYDAVGRETAMIDQRGNRTEYFYDALDRLIRIVNPLGGVDTFTYDAVGNRSQQIDPLGRAISFEFDEAGNISKATYADGSSISYNYDSLGRLVGLNDELGRLTQHGFDSEGNLSQVIDPMGGRTSYEYDEDDNLTSITDAAGRLTTYEYNLLGQQTAIVSPLGFRSETQFDLAGNPIRSIDSDGRINRNFFDAEGRVIRRELYDSQVVQFSYDTNGQLVTMIDATGTTSMSYDVQGRLLQRTGGDGRTISYQYDVAGNIITTLMPGETLNYSYDALGILTAVQSSTAGLTTYQYDLNRNKIGTLFADGTRETRSYDLRDRLTGQSTFSAANSLIQQTTHLLLANGLIASTIESGVSNRQVSYTYDELNRLRSENVSSASPRTTTYSYDAVGNRLQKIDSLDGTTLYTYDLQDRLLTSSLNSQVTTYSYDQSGHLLSEVTGANVSSYTYTADGKLALATVLNSGNTQTASYKYTGDGLRVSRTSNSVETRYLVDDNREYSEIAQEYSPAGVLLKQYIYGEQIISVAQGGQNNVLHTDHLGSVRFVTANGVVTGSSTTDSFGNVLQTSGNAADLPGFAGRNRDSVTGLIDMRARDYNGAVGRFTTSDPFPAQFDHPGTLHRYAFALNNPANFSDPSGFFTLAEQLTSTGLGSELMKTYSKNLGKLFLTAVRISTCVIKPGNQMRQMGAELMAQGVPRGEVLFENGTQMIAAGLNELYQAIKQAYKDIYDDLRKSTEGKYKNFGKRPAKPQPKHWLDEMEDYVKNQKQDFLKKGIKDKFKKVEEMVGAMRGYVDDITVMLTSNDVCDKAKIVERRGAEMLSKFFK